ncbi:tetratricopeptide repeat protein [Nonomuraea sp. NPDC004297]
MKPEDLRLAGNLAAAYHASARAVESDPSAENLAVRAKVLLDHGHVPAAHDVALRAVHRDPASISAITALGLANIDMGRPHEAWDALDTLTGHAPDGPDTALMFARLHHECGMPGEALDVLDRAIARHPVHPDLRLTRAGCREAEEQPDAVMGDLNAILARFPQHVNALAFRGLLHGDDSRYALALADADAAYRLCPGSVLACCALTLARAYAGDLDAAEVAARRAMEFSGGGHLAYAVMAVVHYARGDKENALRRLLAGGRYGSSSDAISLADIKLTACFDMEEYDHALAAADQILALRPGNVAARSMRSMLLLFFDRDDDALEEAEKVLERRPHDFRALSVRALLHLRAGRWSNAEHDALQAMNGRDRRAALFVHGVACVQLGRLIEADAALRGLQQTSAGEQYAQSLAQSIDAALGVAARPQPALPAGHLSQNRENLNTGLQIVGTAATVIGLFVGA